MNKILKVLSYWNLNIYQNYLFKDYKEDLKYYHIGI